MHKKVAFLTQKVTQQTVIHMFEFTPLAYYEFFFSLVIELTVKGNTVEVSE